MRNARIGWVIVAVLVAVMGIATSNAFGGDSASQAPRNVAADSAKGYKYFGSKKMTSLARAAGLRDAKSITSKRVPLPQNKSIGLILLSKQSTTSVRLEEAAKQIARLLGYSLKVCDPNFDSQKVQQCGTSILAQNPSMIISNAHNPGSFGATVGLAAQRNIPWISIGNATTPAKNWIDYGMFGFGQTKLFDTWYFNHIAKTSKASKPYQLLALAAPTVGLSSANSDKQMARDVAKAGSFKLAVHDLDLSNIVQDTLNTVKQALQQYPDLAGISTYCDLCIPLISQSVRQTQGNDRKTVIGGQFSTPQTVNEIRGGTVDGVADSAWEAHIWVSVDQALSRWAFNKPIVRNQRVYRTYHLPGLSQPYMITKANAGKSGPAPIFGPDFVTYFTTKWKAEFSGIGR